MNPDTVSELALTRWQVARRSAGVQLGFAVVGALFTVLPIALLATTSKTSERVLGAVVAVAFAGLSLSLLWSGLATARTSAQEMPRIEATPDQLRFSAVNGAEAHIPRDHIASVLRLRAAGIRGSRIQFRDSEDRPIGNWDLTWLAGPAVEWLTSMGYQVGDLHGAQALEAIRLPVHVPRRGGS